MFIRANSSDDRGDTVTSGPFGACDRIAMRGWTHAARLAGQRATTTPLQAARRGVQRAREALENGHDLW